MITGGGTGAHLPARRRTTATRPARPTTSPTPSTAARPRPSRSPSPASTIAPVAVDDTATVAEDSGANPINVLANDTDIDGGPKTITSVTQPAHGTVAITGGGTGLTYTPDANYCNDGSPTDNFTYTLNGGSTATVAVTVTCVDDDPPSRSTTPPPWPRTPAPARSTCSPTTPTSTAARRRSPRSPSRPTAPWRSPAAAPGSPTPRTRTTATTAARPTTSPTP